MFEGHLCLLEQITDRGLAVVVLSLALEVLDVRIYALASVDAGTA